MPFEPISTDRVTGQTIEADHMNQVAAAANDLQSRIDSIEIGAVDPALIDAAISDRVATWGFEPDSLPLRRFRLALARARLGLGVVNVAHITDSLGWGFNITPGVDLLQKSFAQYMVDELRGQVNGTFSPTEQYRDVGYKVDPSGGGAGGSAAGQGFGFASVALTGTPASNFRKWTGVCDRFAIMYRRRSDGGNMKVTIDGGSAVTVSTTGTSNYGMLYTSAAIARGSHAIKVEPLTSGDLIEVIGVYLYDGDYAAGGVRCWVNGQVGAKLNDFAVVKTSWTAGFTTIDPDLVVISASTNDIIANPTRRTPSQVAADLAATISLTTGAVTNAPSILVVLQPRPQDPNRAGETTEATWAPYRDAIYNVCVTAGAAFVDVGQFLGPGLQSSATAGIGYLDDDLIHWRPEGHRRVGSLLAALVSDTAGRNSALRSLEDVSISGTPGAGLSLAYFNTIDGVPKLTNMPDATGPGQMPITTIFGLLFVPVPRQHVSMLRAARTLTDAAAGDTVTNAADVVSVQASYCSEARISAQTTAAGSSGWGLVLQWCATVGGTWADACTTAAWNVGTSVAVGRGSWVPLVSGAKSDCFFRVISRGGNATADPVLAWVDVEFR